jgi:hypothetical protein
MEFPAEPTGSSTDGVKLTTKTSAVVPGRGSGHSYCEVAAADLELNADAGQSLPFWASVGWPVGWASVAVRTGIRLQLVVQPP